LKFHFSINLPSASITKFYHGDRIKLVERDVTCTISGGGSGEGRLLRKSWSVNLKKSDYVEYVGVYARIILKHILEKWCGRMGNKLIRFRVGTYGGLK
jgi:hypothetical protein